MSPTELPLLRPVDVRQIHHEGAPYFLLRDPQRIAEQQLFVPQSYGPILALLDGRLDTAGICRRLQRAYGVAVDPQIVDGLLDALDQAHMLENERSRARRAAVLEAYRRAPFRMPALAGSGYPSAPDALWALFEEYLEEADDAEPRAMEWSEGVGLLSPHIDYLRGGAVYAHAWKTAAHAVAEADLVVLFGTDHYGSDPITLTRQNYATPYGVLKTAQEVVDALAAAVGEQAAFAGELRHRGEHSLELVAVWLHHMCMRAGRGRESDAARAAPPVVPILCGSLHEYVSNGAQPTEDVARTRALAALRMATAGKRVLYVASGDLAHVGPAFGGLPLGTAALQTLDADDARLLDRLEAGDADGFFAEIKRVQDRNNVCGTAPLYLTLRMLGNVRGEATGYAVCPADEQGTSVVTVAGMLFQAG